ncbi:MAG: dihydroneopterin aldolase [Clostridiales bacterium]|nr:dihydroneopterin aldolase [Clostridiales bacterium]
MDKIVLENMRFRSYSGVLAKEKEEGQEFVITLTLLIERIPGCKTDNIRDTVDYGRVYSMVREYVEEVSCDLIEYMAEQIILRVMRAFSMVDGITCEIKKPLAPIDGEFDSMNVIISRTRNDLENQL